MRHRHRPALALTAAGCAGRSTTPAPATAGEADPVHRRGPSGRLRAGHAPSAAAATASRHRRRRRRRAARRAPRDAGAPALRPRHHQRGEVRRRRLHRAPGARAGLLRDSQGHARPRVPVGQPDGLDDLGRRLGRPGGGQPRGALGAPRSPRPAAQRLLRDRRQRRPADRPRRARGELRHHPDGVPDRDGRQERRAGDRGVARSSPPRSRSSTCGRACGRAASTRRRAFVERVKAFPTNLEVRAIHTFTTPNDPPTGGGGPPQPQVPNADRGPTRAARAC